MIVFRPDVFGPQFVAPADLHSDNEAQQGLGVYVLGRTVAEPRENRVVIGDYDDQSPTISRIPLK